MNRYDVHSDDFYVNVHLSTEMELPSSRETLLHYFEQVQKQFPSMRNFFCRERAEYVLEEEKDCGHHRWVTVEPRRLCSGHLNPASVEESLMLHRAVMELAPFALSVSPLDCESLSVMFGFDFVYRGNHNQLIAEALGVTPRWKVCWTCRGPASWPMNRRSNCRWMRNAACKFGWAWNPARRPIICGRVNSRRTI